MHFRRHVVFAMIALATLVVIPNAYCDWPQWRGPERSGHIRAAELVGELPKEGLAPLWKLGDFEGGNSGGWSSPVISGNHVFVYSHTKTKVEGVKKEETKYPWLAPDKRVGMTDEEYEEYEIKRRDENERQSKAFRYDERLVCLDLSSGEVVWDQKLDSKYTRFTQSGTPCVADGRVYVLGAARTARCYDASTGEVIWSQIIPGEFRDEYYASSFVVESDLAMVACGPIIAMSTKDGQIKWQGDENLDYQSHSSPAVWKTDLGAVVVVNTNGGITQAYRVSDGTKLWDFASGTGRSSPIVADNLLLTYGASRKSGLSAYQLNPSAPEKKPEQVWRFQGAADSGSCPVVRGDAVFVQGEKRLAKVRLADGERLWQTTLKMSTPKFTSLISAGDQLFYGWEGLQSFRAEGDEFQQIYDARVDSEDMLITSDDLRTKLNFGQLKKEPNGLEKTEKLWQQNAVKSGPLGCSTPAFSDGRIVLRLRDAVVCYDLRP